MADHAVRCIHTRSAIMLSAAAGLGHRARYGIHVGIDHYAQHGVQAGFSAEAKPYFQVGPVLTSVSNAFLSIRRISPSRPIPSTRRF